MNKKPGENDLGTLIYYLRYSVEGSLVNHRIREKIDEGSNQSV